MKKENLAQRIQNKAVRAAGTAVGIVLVVMLACAAFQHYREYRDESEAYEKMYEMAAGMVKEVRDNVTECAEYKKDYIHPKWYEFHDFGYGDLNYQYIIVTVPLCDGSRNETGALNVDVYYYVCDKPVIEGKYRRHIRAVRVWGKNRDAQDTAMFYMACDELARHAGFEIDQECFEYSDRYIHPVGYELHDFGNGNMRYLRCEVHIPVSAEDAGSVSGKYYPVTVYMNDEMYYVECMVKDTGKECSEKLRISRE